MDLRITSMIKLYDSYASEKPSQNNKAINNEKKKTNDLFDVSKEGKDFQSVMRALTKTPDVREDKVALIKERLENGSYRVSSEELASAIIENGLK